MTRFLMLLLLLLTTAATSLADEVDELIARGDSAQAAMKLEKALRYYLEAERLAPRNGEILWRLSKVHTDKAAAEEDETRATQLLQSSLRYAERAEAAAPRLAMVQVAYAIAYGQLAVIAPNDEKMELSRKIHDYAQRALELDPKNHPAMLVLGIWNREVASLNWALKLMLDVVYGGLPDASLETSHRRLRACVRNMPRQIMPRVELAKTLIEMDEEDAARSQLRKALSLPPSDIGDRQRIREAREILRDLDS